MSAKRKIVFTGLGAVCGAGLSVDEIWNAVVSGKSAIAPIEQWDASRWPVNVSAEVRNVDNRALVPDRKLHKMISRTDLFGLFAAHQAVEQSGVLAYRYTRRGGKTEIQRPQRRLRWLGRRQLSQQLRFPPRDGSG